MPLCWARSAQFSTSSSIFPGAEIAQDAKIAEIGAELEQKGDLIVVLHVRQVEIALVLGVLEAFHGVPASICHSCGPCFSLSCFRKGLSTFSVYSRSNSMRP